MIEESLLTDDVRALIGRTSEPVRVRLTRRAAERAMDVYYGHHDGAVAPDGTVKGVALAAIENESEWLRFPDLLPDGLLISNEWEFERPLRVDEELTVQSRLADINERFGGRFGYSLYFRSDVEFRDSENILVARSVRTMMQYDAASARDGGEE
jgi:hypothetical protein